MRPDGRPSGPGRPRGARVFFALHPPESVQDKLCQIARELLRDRPGRPTAARNIHLTLAFLGELPLEWLPRLEAVASQVASQAGAFEISLDRLGQWQRKGILWAASSHVPPALLRLEQGLQDGLRANGLPAPPDQRAYQPHVTLARGYVAPAPEPLPELRVSWPCGQFSLVRSRLAPQGPCYQTLASWPLEPPS